MMDEKLHASRRRITNHIYSMSSILESEVYIDKCSDLFLLRMGQYTDEKAVVDLGDWLQKYICLIMRAKKADRGQIRIRCDRRAVFWLNVWLHATK